MDVVNLMQNLSINQINNSEQKLMKSVSADIDDVQTEIVYAEFSDKILLIISQFNKVGGMLSVQQDQIHYPQGGENIFTTKVLFGVVKEEQEVAVRYLAEALNIQKPLNIFICLKSYDIETLKACRDIILDLKKEAGN